MIGVDRALIGVVSVVGAGVSAVVSVIAPSYLRPSLSSHRPEERIEPPLPPSTLRL